MDYLKNLACGSLLARYSSCVFTSLLAFSDLRGQGVRVRNLGPIIAESAQLVSGIAGIRVLAHGRVLVNDGAARRLLLFDSTLANYVVVLDSIDGKSNSYGPRFAGMIPYGSDSTLFVDIANGWMLLLDGDAHVLRTMTLPRADATFLVGGQFGQPVIDNAGRLIYTGNPRLASPPKVDVPGSEVATLPDSFPIVRLKLATHRLDTAAMVMAGALHSIVHRFETGALTLVPIQTPVSLPDDWAAVPDGSVAIVRGREFRVEWVNADGTRTIGPKLQFDWQRIDAEGQKQALVDSTRAYWEEVRARRLADGSVRNPLPIYVVSASELPDYMPPFARPSARADREGNIWIRSTTISENSAIYYVVDRRGELIDRVKPPPHRYVIGFGEGDIVYLAVRDGAGVRLDRARIR